MELAKRMPEKSFDRLRLEGYVAVQKNDAKTALAKFSEANAIRPMDPSLVLAYTQMLIANNQFAEAEKLGLELIAKDKTYGPMYDVLYRQYVGRSRQAVPEQTKKEFEAKAEQLWRQKADNNPSVSEYRLQLAAHYFVRGQAEEGERAIRVITSDPKTFPDGLQKVGDFHLMFRQFDKAMAYYREGLSKNPQQKLDFQRKIADTLITQGKQKEALDYLEKEILKDNPKDSAALAMRASLWLDTGNRAQLQQAVGELEASVGKLPQNAVVRFNLGRAYWAKGDLDQARNQFRAALDLQPDYLAPRLALGQIYLAKGELQMALQTANETLTMSPGNLEARLIRGAALQGVGKPDEARAELQAILKADPSVLQARMQLGLLELKLEELRSCGKDILGVHGPARRQLSVPFGTERGVHGAEGLRPGHRTALRGAEEEPRQPENHFGTGQFPGPGGPVRCGDIRLPGVDSPRTPVQRL